MFDVWTYWEIMSNLGHLYKNNKVILTSSKYNKYSTCLTYGHIGKL